MPPHVTDPIQDVLKKLGWTDGFQIPVANDENKALQEEMARLTLQRMHAKNHLDNTNAKCEALERHLKFVTQENEQTYKLISAHKQQLDEQSHQFRIGAAEKDRLLQDIRQAQRKNAAISSRNEEKKNDIKTGLAKIDAIKNETFWDEEALKAWEESLRKRDDDNELLKKFSRDDEKKFTELEAKRAGLQQEFMERQITIGKMVNDLINYETMLQRTGKVIKKQMLERDALVTQWKDTVKLLHQRDNDISRSQSQLLDLFLYMQKEQENLENENEMLKIEKRNNKELELEMQSLNALNSRLRKEFDKLLQYNLYLNNELNGTKRLMTKTANTLEDERCKGKTLNKAIDKREDEIEKVQQKLEKLDEKLRYLEDESMTAAERCRQIEKLIDYETSMNTVHLADGEKYAHILFKTQTKLQEQYDITKRRELESGNLSNTIDYLRKTNKDAQVDVDKKKETIYNMEFKIDQMEERLHRIDGDNDEEDEEELTIKVTELEKIHSEETETRNLLQEQLTRIQDEMRRLTTAITNDVQKLTDLNNNLQTLKLLYEGGLKHAATAKAEAQEKQVEENLLILRLKQFNKWMKKEENDIYNMQKMKLNLEQAMRERELEINTNKEILAAQRRNLDEDSGRLRCDIKNRQIKAEQLQKKYQIVIASLGTDKDGQTLSVTYFKLKSTQEKYFLKTKGDDLDNKIKTIENEIVAMENTLKVVNMTNAAFKQSLGAIGDDSQEMVLMKQLQSELMEKTDAVRCLKKDLASNKQEIVDMENEMVSLNEKKTEFTESLANLEIEFHKLQKDCESKQEKLKRTGNLLKKMEKKLTQEMMLKYDRDLEIKLLIETNRQGLQKIGQLGAQYEEILPVLNKYASEYNIKLPDLKFILTKFSDSNLSSMSSLQTSEQKSSSSSSSVRSRGTCNCSAESSSIASVIISFDGNKSG